MTAEGPVPPAVLAELARFDTPTVCNALEAVAPERRTIGFTTRPLVCAEPGLAPIVGYARTATIRAVEPSGRSAEAERTFRAAYYDYIATPPGPTVTVIQDLDPEPGFGAWWGEVNSTVHKALGCLGAVTDGSMRDLDALAPGFQILAGRVGPSHAWVHVVGFGDTVNVHGMGVRHGDLIHADRHGAVVIPHAAARAIAAAVDLIGRREAMILAACRRPDFDLDVLRRALDDAAKIS